MEFPTLAPSSRQYSDGDWPVKEYQAMDGYSVRVLYGSRQFGMTLQLSYQNITDTQAAEFLDHYRQQQGTFTPFLFGPEDGPRNGWSADKNYMSAAAQSNSWKYVEAPTVTSVKPGISTVNVNLIAVLR